MKIFVLLFMRFALVLGIIMELSSSQLGAQTSNHAVYVSPMNFGSVVLGENALGLSVLENLTQDTLIIEDVSNNDQEISFRIPLDIRGLTIRPKQKVSMDTIRFAPRSIGLKRADVIVHYRRNGLVLSDTLRNALSGKGTWLKVVIPDTIFGRVGLSTPMNVVVINRGTAFTEFQRVQLLGREAVFQVRTDIIPRTVGVSDTVFLSLVFVPRNSGVVRNSIEVIVSSQFIKDTLLIPLLGSAREVGLNDVVLQPFLRVTPDSAKPGDEVKLELALRGEQRDLVNIIRAATPQFTAVIAIGNRNLLTLQPTERGASTVRGLGAVGVRYLSIPRTAWDGRSNILTSLQCLAMIADTDYTSIELVELHWGGPRQNMPQLRESQIWVDTAPVIPFAVKTSFAGGKRLFTTVKATSLVHSIAPNPATSFAEMQYTIEEKSMVECSLINTHGVVVKQLWSGLQQSGTHTLSIPTDDLASGLYAVRLQTLLNVEHVMLRVLH